MRFLIFSICVCAGLFAAAAIQRAMGAETPNYDDEIMNQVILPCVESAVDGTPGIEGAAREAAILYVLEANAPQVEQAKANILPVVVGKPEAARKAAYVIALLNCMG